MTTSQPCGCRIDYDAKRKAFVREVCARHMVLHDAKGNTITFDKPVVVPHLGREVEKIKSKKVKR
jgi:predicted RNase H-like nuclease